MAGRADSTSTGAAQNITLTKTITTFTNASLTSIQNLTIANRADATMVTLRNKTGGTLTLKNLSGGTSANQINTGTGADIALVDSGAVNLYYDTVLSKWQIVSAVGTDVSATNITAGTLSVLYGGTGRNSLTSHSVLVGNGTSGVTQISVGTAGQLLAGAASADPAFSSTPTLGINGSVAGTLGLANSGGSGATVTVGVKGATSAYNFNLPDTAGSSGDALISGGGASTSMTWKGVATANTLSAIVARDGSGNFSAGTITAALTGTASGNLTATPSNHGMLISSGTNAVTVLAPDASTTKVWTSGGSSADPSWQTPSTNAATTTIVDDTTTNATMYPTWVTTTSGSLPQKVSSTKLSFNPSTATMSLGTSTATINVPAQGAPGAGGSLSILSGASGAGGTNDAGGDLGLYSALGTGTGASKIVLNVPQLQASGTTAQTSYSPALTVLTDATYVTQVKAQDSLRIGAASGRTGGLLMYGTTSGVVTIKSQDAAGTFNFNLPITAGTSGFALLSGGGGSSPMTWSAVLSNPMTTTGDIIYSSDGSGTPARLAAGTTGQVLTSAGAAAPSWSTPSQLPYNFLINGAFDLWQVGTSATVTATGGGTPTNAYLYQADQWYVRNILGGGTIEGIITYSQQAAVTNGSGFGARVKITTAPTGTGIQNGAELWQTLSNIASKPLYGQTASFTILVRCLNNVNQVGAQFFYATTEVKAVTSIGSEQTVTCNTSTFVSLTISGQALGTSQTLAGTIGVRVRPTAVSSGNLYDLNNGFEVEQGMLNLGTTAATFYRQSQNPDTELHAAQYFYEKSYDTTVAPATNTQVGSTVSGAAAANTATKYMTMFFKSAKRAIPSVTLYTQAGTSGKWTTDNATPEQTTTAGDIGVNSFGSSMASGASCSFVGGHWVADARL